MPISWLIRLLLVAMVSVVCAEAAAEGPADLQALLEQIASSKSRPEGARAVQGFRLKTALALVHLDDGVLVPATPVGDRAVEFAFIGRGRFEMDAPDDIESGQLELFTGATRVDEPFERAVFVVALDAAADAIMALPAATADDRVSAAAGLLDEWRASPERRLLDVDARLLADAVDDPLARGFFSGYFEGASLGRLLYVTDPLAEEQITLGQFVPVDLSGPDRRRAERHLERQQRRGKLIGLELADLGQWDTWVSASLRDSKGSVAPGSTGVEPLRYTIDLSLEGKQLRMESTATIQLQTLVEGLRAVRFDLEAGLEPTGVRDGDGNQLPYLRSQGELTVLLAAPQRSGSTFSIEVRYEGEPFERLASQAYAQRSTLGWYPHAGLVDRATYDVTLRWPAKYELEGSGRVVDEGVAEKGMRWQRRTLEVRSLGFSFEIGDYDVMTGQVGHVAVRVAIDRLGRQVSRDLADEVLMSVRDSLAYFEEVFGAYPLDQLVVVSSPRGNSQGLLGFVTLSTVGIIDWDIWAPVFGFEDRRTLIAHEIAHQWWGNLVGWSSYRDQWISEAMANYSALLYARNRLAGARVWVGPTAGWKSELLATTADGRTIESLGPVVLGARLNSSRSRRAYFAIVYKKGAVVLDMLSRFFQEEAFLQALSEIVRIGSDRVLSTDNLLQLLEGLGGTDLDWFSRQFIFGTGLPEIYYGYDLRPLDEGRWVVEGEARQQAPFRFTYSVVSRPDGGLDVARSAVERMVVEDSVLVVPFQIGLRSQAVEKNLKRSSIGAPERRYLIGKVLLDGEVSRFRFELEVEPEIMWLDRRGEVFGRFFCSSRWPRRVGYFEGLDLVAAGELEPAERKFQEALRAEVARVPEGWQEIQGDLDLEARLMDARIHLALARLYLDTDRTSRAAEEIARAESRLKREDRWRFRASLLNLEARLKLRSGEADRAFKMLRRGVFGRDGLETIEGLALLAVAADATGNDDEYRRACGRAGQRGVELGPLECP